MLPLAHSCWTLPAAISLTARVEAFAPLVVFVPRSSRSCCLSLCQHGALCSYGVVVARETHAQAGVLCQRVASHNGSWPRIKHTCTRCASIHCEEQVSSALHVFPQELVHNEARKLGYSPSNETPRPGVDKLGRMLVLKQSNHIIRVTFSAASQEEFANGTLTWNPDGGLALNKTIYSCSEFSFENPMFGSVQHAESKLRCREHSQTTIIEGPDDPTAFRVYVLCSASLEAWPEKFNGVGFVNLANYMGKNTKSNNRPFLPTGSWSLVVFPNALEATCVHYFLTHGVARSAILLCLQVKQEVMIPVPGVDVRCIPEKASLAAHWLFTGSDAKTVLGHIRGFVIKAVVGKSDLVATDGEYTDVLQSMKERADKRQGLCCRCLDSGCAALKRRPTCLPGSGVALRS